MYRRAGYRFPENLGQPEKEMRLTDMQGAKKTDSYGHQIEVRLIFIL